MSAPKHLWSGDWERESDEAAARRRSATPLPEVEPPAEPPLSRATVVAQPTPKPPRTPPKPPRDPGPSRQRWRLAAIALAVAALVVGAAFGLSAIFGSDSGSQRSAAKPGWLGLRLGVLPTGGVVVTGFEHGSPAEAAGVRTGDIITEVQSRPVAAPIDVVLAVDALRAGETIELGALHGSTAYTTRVRLRARPSGSP